MSQTLRLLHVSNLSVLNFRIFILVEWRDRARSRPAVAQWEWGVVPRRFSGDWWLLTGRPRLPLSPGLVPVTVDSQYSAAARRRPGNFIRLSQLSPSQEALVARRLRSFVRLIRPADFPVSGCVRLQISGAAARSQTPMWTDYGLSTPLFELQGEKL